MAVEQQVDVVVAGAGPAGLTVAGDLARSGRSVLVLERWASLNPASRAFATQARTLEVLDARGLADQLLQNSSTASRMTVFTGAHVDFAKVDSPYPFIMITPQTNVDQALAGYAAVQGADLRRGFELIGLVQDDDGVTVTAQPHGGGESQQWRASYLVGADGAHSTVRGLLGVDFPGDTILTSVALADLKLTHEPASQGLTLNSNRDVFAILAPYGRRDDSGAWYRAMVWDRNNQLPDTAPAGEDEIVGVLSRVFAEDFGVQEITWTSRFHCDERQVDQYRHGRVFLVGDAAHVHSPMGGQGMNTGIQDAANLGWKIDAVLNGANDALLDTYHEERHPVGKRVLVESGLMARGIKLHNRLAFAARNAIAPAVLGVPMLRDALAGSLAGTTIRYRHHHGEHPLVGTRATQIPLVDGRLTELQRQPGFVFIYEKGTDSGDIPTTHRTQRRDDGPAVLVRPDGYIAWAGESTDRAGWSAALNRYR